MCSTEKPLVTVIVPAYNHEAWVKETILSVVNQTYGYENIQLIVTDDCSSDNTPNILCELASQYNFELILHQNNKGISLTLNEMISIAKGKYISGIASDDIMFLDKIENQINILLKNPDIDILAGTCIFIDKNGKVIPSTAKNYDSSLILYTFQDLFLKLKPGFPAGSTIIKRELYERIGAYDSYYKIEDYYFWLKAAYNKAKIIYCNKPFYFYRLIPSSVSSNRELMNKEEDKILAIYEQHSKYTVAKQNKEIYELKKLVQKSKSEVIRKIMRNKKLLLNKFAIKVLIMLMIPNFLLKQKFPETHFRNAKL